MRAWGICSVITVAALLVVATRLSAQSASPASDERLVTIYDQGVEQTIITRASTVKDALEQASIELDQPDAVEPALGEQLLDRNYQINVYRARPVLVVDGAKRERIMTAEQSPRQIVRDAGATLYDEDIATFDRIDSVMSDGGAGLKLSIDRATVFQFTLYGKPFEARTQAATVGAMLAEKGVTLGQNDGVSAPLEAPLVAGMSISVWRNGKQTVTIEENIAKPVEEVKDTARELGFREVKTAGVDGKKQVTYEIEMRDGVEVSRTAINSVTTLEPIKEVVVVGAKLPTPTNPTEAQAMGRQMMLAAGFGEDQWPCLYNLWREESGWTVTADNPTSDAYGIPQALPGSKMGPGWEYDARVQINWGLGYIKGRYGTPCAAYSTKKAQGWY